MKLDKIVSITGKSGLYRIIAETPKRIIVESIDEAKKKLPVSSNFQVALLDKITIFTLDNSDLLLGEIFDKMDSYEGDVPPKSENAANLRTFFREIAPNHDENKVYSSDLKKIIRWYHLLKDHHA